MIKPLQSITLKNDNGEDTTYVVASAPAIVETIEPASVASFSDGAEGIPVKSLFADINPVQNLNGQSAPYPAGGGKNLLNVTESGVTSSQRCTMTGTEGNLTFTSTGNYARVGFSISNLTVGNTYTFSCKAQKTVTSGKPSVIYLGTSDWTYNIGSLNVSPNGGRDTGDEVSLTKTFTATDSTFFFGVYVTADTGSGDVVKVKDAMLESGGSATAYAPYSNICPITGWTGMNITRAGKNILYKKISGATIGSTGKISTSSDYDVYVAEVAQGETYVVSGNTDSANGYVIAYYTADPVVGDVSYNNSRIVNSSSKTFTAAIYGYVAVRANNADTSVQLEVGSTATTYEPYNGTTYPISWADEAGTVYGGTLDVTTGLLTVTHGTITLDGTETWTLYNGAVWTDAIADRAYGSGINGTAICDKLVSTTGNVTGGTSPVIKSHDWAFTMFSSNVRTYFYSSTLTTLEEWKTWFGANTPTICYLLATPVTYQLTPQAVLTILGQNNIWADTGDVEVAYVADTKLYIDKVLTE